MTDRRDFLKYCGLGLMAVILTPGGLLPSPLNFAVQQQSCCQPRRMMYGNRLHGCSGWHGSPNELDLPK